MLNEKVDWVMENLHQTDYPLQTCDFTAEDVINALNRLKGCHCGADCLLPE